MSQFRNANRITKPLKQTTLNFWRKPSSSEASGTPPASKEANQDNVAGSELEDNKSLSGKPGSTNESEKSPEKEASRQDSTVTSRKVVINDIVGDLFDAPDGTVLIHACNGVGNWGAGIAAAFRQKYPNAFRAHVNHCKQRSPKSLLGTAQLIPPLEKTGRKHYIGCLFTSARFGRYKDPPHEILRNTGPAMEDLLRQVSHFARQDHISEIRMCQINSGLFAVPWNDTKDVVEKIEIDDEHCPTEITAYSLG